MYDVVVIVGVITVLVIVSGLIVIKILSKNRALKSDRPGSCKNKDCSVYRVRRPSLVRNLDFFVRTKKMECHTCGKSYYRFRN